MRHLIVNKRFALGVSIAALLAGSTAEASLIIDVRVASGNAKSVTVTPGQVVQLNVYGIVTGSNATADEGLQTVQGSFVSTLNSGGSAIGNFSAFAATSPFNGTVQTGVVQDINGQNGLDVGGKNATVANDPLSIAGDYVSARSSVITTNDVTANPEFLLGTLQWTVSSIPASGSTTLNFVPRLSLASPGGPLNTAALWREDGASRNPTSSTFAAGTPVTVAVPEPGTAAVAGIAAGLGLLARRRQRA